MQAGDPPGLVTQRLSDAGTYAADGQAVTCNDVFADVEESLGELEPAVEDKTKIGEDYYIAPYSFLAGNCFHYRRDIYEEIGLSEPEVWDDLLENVRAVDESDLDIKPISISAVPGGGKSNNDTVGWLRTAGGGIWQWKSEEDMEIEPYMPKEPTIATLEFLNELAQYSPDPSAEDWGPSIQHYTDERVAHSNFYGCLGITSAAAAGNDKVVENTEIMLYPLRERGIDYRDRGYTLTNGFWFPDSDTQEGAKEFAAWYLSDPETHGRHFHPDPISNPPAFESVLNSDTYQNAPLLQDYENARDQVEKLVSEMLPEMGSRESLFWTPNRNFVGQPTISEISDMVNRVLVLGETPESSWQKTVENLSELAEQANEKAKQLN